MQIKTSLSIVITLVCVVSTILFIGIGVDLPDGPDKAGADNNAPGLQHLARFYKEIEGASTPAQFAAVARAMISEVPHEHLNELMEMLFERWVEKDLMTALDFASGLEESGIRQTLLRFILVKGGYFDFRSVMAWISRQPQSARQNLTGILYEGTGKENPEYALRFIDLLNEGETKERVMRTLLEQWAQRDTAAALAWMNMQELPQALADLKASLMFSLMHQDPQEAGSLIRNMQPGHEKNTLARKNAELMAREDVQAATTWARSFDDPDSYGIALTAVYEAWFQKEPDKKLIMEQVLAESDSGLRDRLINEIALDIANSDPAELAALIDRLPDTAQPDVAEKAVRFWKDRDQRQTLNWINTLVSGPVRDRALKVMVEDFLLRGDEEGAISLASSIGDGGVRYDSVRNAAEHWYRTNPGEAQRMLEGISFLSESEKATIRQHIQKAYP